MEEKRKKLHESLSYYSLILVAVTLPFEIKWCSFAIALFVLNELISGAFFRNIKTIFLNKYVWLFSGFYLLHIIGLLYTEDMRNGFFDLEKKSALFIFPILLSYQKISRKKTDTILVSFLSSCIVLSIVFLAVASYRFINSGNFNSFFFEQITSPTGIHRVYFSMYLLFCLFIIIYLKKSIIINSLSFYLLASFLVFMIVLMTSRMVIMLTLISLAAYFAIEAFQNKSYLKYSAIGLLFLLSISSFLFFNPQAKNILVQTFTDLDKGNSLYNHTGPNQRVQIWKAAAELASKNIMGVGTGDTQNKLWEQYQENNFIWGIEYKFNAHNQYLETFIGLGLLGLLVLVLSLTIPTYISFKKRNYLYLGLIIIFSMCCLAESMLCSQKGIVFYAFFNSLLFFPNRE